MEKNQEITNITSDFIESVKELISSGVIKNQSDLAEKLNWDASTLSETINKKRNVPHHIYTRFKKAFILNDGKRKQFIQNEKTKLFFEMLNNLLNNGVYGNYKDMVDDLDWSYSSFTAAKHGTRNVPNSIINKLKHVAKSSKRLQDGNVLTKIEVAKFSTSEIVEAVQEELIRSYGGLAVDSKGNEIQTPYLVLGILRNALDKLNGKYIATKLRQNPADVSTSPPLSDFEIQDLLYKTDKTIERRNARIAKNGVPPKK